MSWITILSRQGQITIPKEARDQLGLKPFDKVHFDVVDGEARMRRLPSLEEIAGSLPPLGMPVEQAIRLAREEHAMRLVEKMQRSLSDEHTRPASGGDPAD
jgi:AbrB family looped-hinge helix DNA binding protein